ncbi:MAG: hypothetical protein DWH79_01975 [Planctomycetota bacterium]|nr:MAG: hypothetical protein DWH79_01975 [Planctomycetota bacterium]
MWPPPPPWAKQCRGGTIPAARMPATSRPRARQSSDSTSDNAGVLWGMWMGTLRDFKRGERRTPTAKGLTSRG